MPKVANYTAVVIAPIHSVTLFQQVGLLSKYNMKVHNIQ